MGQGASYQPLQRPVLCTAAPLCVGCHHCLPSHSVWMPKSRRGKWVQSLCSSNRLDERWHHDQREEGKQLWMGWSGLAQEGPVRDGDKVIFVSLSHPLCSRTTERWQLLLPALLLSQHQHCLFPGAFPAGGGRSELICRERSWSALGHPRTSWAHQNSGDPSGARQLPTAGHLDTGPRRPEDPS